jgi:UDP-glucose 4-epimerase
MKIVVTGGFGFIGTNLVLTLLNREHRVVVIDNFSSPQSIANVEYVKSKYPAIEYYDADVLDDRIADIFEDTDVFVHLAAQKSVDQSIVDPVGSMNMNIGSVVKLLNIAKTYKVKRFVFASSAAIYGNLSDFPLDESVGVDPRSPYALEKVVGEEYMKLFHNLYGLDTVSLRLFNVYGPFQYSQKPHCGAVTLVMKQFEEKGCSVLLGDGIQTRDMIYVQDVVDAFVLAVESKTNFGGKAYNICTGQETQIKEMHKTIAKLMNISEPNFDSIKFEEGNVKESLGSPMKAKELGFEPKVSLEMGLQLTLDWYRENSSMYQ